MSEAKTVEIVRTNRVNNLSGVPYWFVVEVGSHYPIYSPYRDGMAGYEECVVWVNRNGHYLTQSSNGQQGA